MFISFFNSRRSLGYARVESEDVVGTAVTYFKTSLVLLPFRRGCTEKHHEKRETPLGALAQNRKRDVRNSEQGCK